jgi:SAM-dependent methyltransferase
MIMEDEAYLLVHCPRIEPRDEQGLKIRTLQDFVRQHHIVVLMLKNMTVPWVDNSDRKNPSDRLRFLHADVEMWASNAPTSSCDLIVSNVCFQWLNKPEQTFSHLRRIFRTGGY